MRKSENPTALMSFARQDALDKEVEDSRRAVAAEPNSVLARMRSATKVRSSSIRRSRRLT